MKKRTLNLLIAASFVIVFSLLTAVVYYARTAGTKSLEGEHLTLALRRGIYADVIKKCLAEFEKKYGIPCVVYEFSEGGLRDAVLHDASFAQGKYDFCMVDGSWMAEYTAQNVLASLSELDYELDDDIIRATKSICYHNGSLYLAPYYGNVTVLLYNKLLIQDAGYTPDSIDSIDDILKICRITNKRHNLGFMYRGDTANNIVVDFLPVLLSFGGWVVDSENNPTINTPEFREAMTVYLKLVKTGRAAKKDDLIAAIANRSAAVGIGWPGWYTPTRNSSMDYLALNGKADSDLPAYNANIYGIWTVGIPANSTNKTKAVELLRYLMDAEIQKITVDFGGVPCRYSSLQDEEVLKKFPQYKVVCEALENGVYRPVMKEWSEFYTILGREMKSIIDGDKTVLTGLSAAQVALQKMKLEHAGENESKK